MSSSSIAGAASSEGPALVRRPRAIVASVRTVVKRDGTSEPVRFDAIYDEIRRCADMAEPPLHERVDTSIVAQKTIAGLFNGITTEELSELASEDAAALTSLHHDYSRLAAILANVNHQKKVKPTFSQAMTDLFDYTDIKTGKDASMLDPTVYAFIMEHAETLDAAVQPVRDMLIDYFGFKTLEHSYFLKKHGKQAETWQYVIMRVACGLWAGVRSMPDILETYRLMSLKFFTHATPTLFNAGTRCPQLSSCFLLSTFDDSIDGIYETLKCCAMISKQAGGIGLSVNNIRAAGSYIRGTNGTSNGLIPMLRVFNNTARYVDQGGGKRKGAFAIYLEPWHADILPFLEMKKNHGIEEERARDLFYGLWVNDLFMRRVEADADWSLFCPNEAPGLAESHSEAFDELYMKYEKIPGKARRVLKAREVWQAILGAQTETGTPYMLFKDAANNKSNQQNLGTIRCSNLCTEIIEYTSPKEIAVCNLASIALPMLVNKAARTFDHQTLFDIAYQITKNLNRVIDVNFPFESAEARVLNKDIFETIYFAALTASTDLSRQERDSRRAEAALLGKSVEEIEAIQGWYDSYPGSPMSQGRVQFNMWKVRVNPNDPSDLRERFMNDTTDHSGRWDWVALKREIAEVGVRNSLLLAPMPTASTSQILGNNECFEPFTSNIYVRRTLAGEFTCATRHLLDDLVELGVWSPALKDKIVARNGSVQGIEEIPAHIQALYRTVWEISQKTIIDMAADRGVYIDQHMTNVSPGKLTSMHFHAWKRGLKTGMYYLRTKAAQDAIKFSLDQTVVAQEQQKMQKQAEAGKAGQPKATTVTSVPPSAASAAAAVAAPLVAAAAVSLPLMRQNTTDPELQEIAIPESSAEEPGVEKTGTAAAAAATGSHTPRSSQHFQASELESTEANRARLRNRRMQLLTMKEEDMAAANGSCKGGMCSS